MDKIKHRGYPKPFSNFVLRPMRSLDSGYVPILHHEGTVLYPAHVTVHHINDGYNTIADVWAVLRKYNRNTENEVICIGTAEFYGATPKPRGSFYAGSKMTHSSAFMFDTFTAIGSIATYDELRRGRIPSEYLYTTFSKHFGEGDSNRTLLLKYINEHDILFGINDLSKLGEAANCKCKSYSINPILYKLFGHGYIAQIKAENQTFFCNIGYGVSVKVKDAHQKYNLILRPIIS